MSDFDDWQAPERSREYWEGYRAAERHRRGDRKKPKLPTGYTASAVVEWRRGLADGYEDFAPLPSAQKGGGS